MKISKVQSVRNKTTNCVVCMCMCVCIVTAWVMSNYMNKCMLFTLYLFLHTLLVSAHSSKSSIFIWLDTLNFWSFMNCACTVFFEITHNFTWLKQLLYQQQIVSEKNQLGYLICSNRKINDNCKSHSNNIEHCKSLLRLNELFTRHFILNFKKSWIFKRTKRACCLPFHFDAGVVFFSFVRPLIGWILS